MIRQSAYVLAIQTVGRGLVDITSQVLAWVGDRHRQGLLTLFVHHTSASLLMQENAGPDVRADLDRFFARLVKDGDPLFVHRDEGPDDMPAHVRAALSATQLSIPICHKSFSTSVVAGNCLPSLQSCASNAKAQRKVSAICSYR